MDKAEFLRRVGEDWAAWEAVLAGLAGQAGAALVAPGFCDDWSAKDVVAHIAWYEREITGLIEAHALAGSEMWDLPLDERNEAIYQANRERSLQAVREEAAEVHARLLAALETLSDEDLNDPARFAGMPADWLPWQVIASDTFEHYREHLPS
jgi:hypothetical protein